MSVKGKQYLIEYPGFSKVFKTSLVCASEAACRELPKDLDEKIHPTFRAF